MSRQRTTSRSDSTSSRWSMQCRAAAVAAVGVLLLAACGDSKQSSDGTAVAGSGTTANSSANTPAPTAPAAGSAGAALLTPADLGTGWELMAATYHFPNDAEMAATVGECSEFVDIVFAGGKQHGSGASATLGNGQDLVFTYVVAFDTEEQAAAMLDAMKSPAFAECWAKFNEVAVPTLPIGVTSATYESVEPPVLDIEADAVAVLHLEGEVKFGDTAFADTCTCAFVQAGRGVVEVHTTDFVFTPEERSALIQLAVERMRETLD